MRMWLLMSLSFELAMISAVGAGAANIGHFLRPLVDQKDDQFHLRMIFHDGVGDVLKECRLAGARRSDDQTALALAERRHQIHDPRGVTIGRRFQLDPLVRD